MRTTTRKNRDNARMRLDSKDISIKVIPVGDFF